jgi:hypothetical protein
VPHGNHIPPQALESDLPASVCIWEPWENLALVCIFVHRFALARRSSGTTILQKNFRDFAKISLGLKKKYAVKLSKT